MKLYVIGKVTGCDFLNAPEFTRAKFKLEGAGYEVSIPHDSVPQYASWEQAMRISISELLKAEGIALLRGWIDSRGAKIEYDLAREIGIPAYNVDWWISYAHYLEWEE